jgi:hypothetical protein
MRQWNSTFEFGVYFDRTGAYKEIDLEREAVLIGEE